MSDFWEDAHVCMQGNTADAGLDYDGDLLINGDESCCWPVSADPCDPDTDNDGMPDGWEYSSQWCGLNLLVGDSLPDPDEDGVSNLAEYQASTDPCVAPDADGDGLADYWESLHACMWGNTADATLDHDTDGLTNLTEHDLLSDPCDPDTDGDGMPDGWEQTYRTCAGLNLLVPNVGGDPDGDGLVNLDEYLSGTHPCDSDSDNDTILDGEETVPGADGYVTNPLLADTDGDGLRDDAEINTYLTNPTLADSDSDGMNDPFEVTYQVCAGLDPMAAGNTLGDGDADQLSNLGEFGAGTHPCRADTDYDGLPDGWEYQYRSCVAPLSYASEAYSAASGPSMRVTANASVSVSSSLAWSGSEFGLSWHDNRDGNYEIYFSRIDATGTAIGGDRRVTTDSSTSFNPSLAWTGTEYGVSWYDGRAGVLQSPEIYFARLSSEGVKIGADLRVNSLNLSSLNPALAWTGSQFGLVWHDNYLSVGNYEILLTRITWGGIKNGGDVRLSNNNLVSRNARLAWTGTEFGLAWEDNRNGNYEIYFVRVSAGGSKIGAETRITANSAASNTPSLAWSGSEYAIAWGDDRDGNNEIYFVRLAADGTRIGGDLRICSNNQSSTVPWLVFGGGAFGLAWQDNRDGNNEIYFARLTADGIQPGPNYRLTSATGNSNSPVMAWSGSEFGLSWYDNRDGNNEIYFNRVVTLYTDKDGDGLTEEEEYALGTSPCASDSDGDGLPDPVELGLGTSPTNPDSDDDGLTDGAEVATHTTDPLDWDSDSDYLPDGYEVLHGASLDPLDPADAGLDPDGDTNPTTHEYYNDSDPWSPDPVPMPGYDVGCYFWGKGDGGPYVQPSDITKIQMAYVGAAMDYSRILPSAFDPLDLDRSGVPDPADITLAQYMYIEADRPTGFPSSPTSLSLEYAPVAAVAVGDTTHVTVSVHAQGPGTELYSPGFGVVFWVTSGNAVLLGGEGTDPGEAVGNRYDVSMDAASGALANIVVLVTGPGPVVVNAKAPGCGVEPVGRWCAEVVLPAAVVINP